MPPRITNFTVLELPLLAVLEKTFLSFDLGNDFRRIIAPFLIIGVSGHYTVK